LCDQRPESAPGDFHSKSEIRPYARTKKGQQTTHGDENGAEEISGAGEALDGLPESERPRNAKGCRASLYLHRH
jgi:hypothetical protein